MVILYINFITLRFMCFQIRHQKHMFVLCTFTLFIQIDPLKHHLLHTNQVLHPLKIKPFQNQSSQLPFCYDNCKVYGWVEYFFNLDGIFVGLILWLHFIGFLKLNNMVHLVKDISAKLHHQLLMKLDILMSHGRIQLLLFPEALQ